MAKLSSETPPASELMKVLRDMHQFGWNRYLAARSRTASLKPDHFFFGDEDRAEDLVQRIEGRYRNRLARAMRRALEAP
jgi:hypothetical protein